MSLKSFANLRQIAFALGRDYRRKMVYIAYGLAPGARYKEFTIPKKSGGERRICAPRIALLKLQRDILRLLEGDYRPRAHVHGFISGKQRSIVSNARQHVGKRWVLNIDLEDYFETIHFGRVRGRLMAPPYGYPEEIAQFIAHISCFQTEKEVDGALRTTHVLMPGAALSPILANIVSDKLDAELARFCRQLGCTYTRYADDITISSNRRTFPAPIGRFANLDSHDEFILSDTFQQMIEDNGFRINHTKTRLLGLAFQQEVTGLIVNEKVNVKRKFVRDVRAMLHDWELNGFAAASARHFNEKRPDRGRLSEQEATNYEWVVRGKIEFIRQVKGSTDQVFRRLAARFNALCSGQHISIPLVEDSDVLNAAVWYLENDTDGGSVGTCFAVDTNLFVTCAHCLGPNLRIFPRQNPAFPMEADEVARDDHNDLALIRLRTPLPAFNPAATLQMASSAEFSALGIRSAVQAAGYPSNLDSTSLTIRDTEVTGFSQQTFDGTPATSDNVIAMLSGTYEGMSGGPVLFSGKVVGVIVRGPNDDDRTIPFLAVKSGYVNDLLASL
ncbi:reverse transcriptase domain-containing protein [Phaeobacter inhibens]|uniref:reverse transcriptase domain-containing protein n=1 Tax=Phaeobacter inhibens TaxID=221822 RepID=UPI0021A8E24B|nr:reverse transcriptase domain-containing protein [Phaeobacter inhibens]UWR72698.1 trypsin-like peptidase domain-containing protein [Phaeobacter inhibens]